MKTLRDIVKEHPEGFRIPADLYGCQLTCREMNDGFKKYKGYLGCKSNPPKSFLEFLYTEIFLKKQVVESFLRDCVARELGDRFPLLMEEMRENYLTFMEVFRQNGSEGVCADPFDIIGTYRVNMYLTSNDINKSIAESVKKLVDVIDLKGGISSEDDIEKAELFHVFQNPLSLLVYSQGHKMSRIMERYLYNDPSGDGKSIEAAVAEELERCRRNDGCRFVYVALLATIDRNSIGILDNIAKKEGAITFPEGSVAGLCDIFSGETSHFGIRLEKPFTVEASMVYPYFNGDIRPFEISPDIFIRNLKMYPNPDAANLWESEPFACGEAPNFSELFKKDKDDLFKACVPGRIRWTDIIKLITKSTSNITRFEVNGNEEILCKTQEDAECIADFLEVLGVFDVVHTSDSGDSFYPVAVYPD